MHICHGDHSVQFYDNDIFLSETLLKYFLEPLQRNEAAILIATYSHLTDFSVKLKACGINEDALRASGQLVTLDASSTLSDLMSDEQVDCEKFQEHVGNLVMDMKDKFSGLQAYGEMANLLFQEGQHQQALELEVLWNELGRKVNFNLLCSYSSENLNLNDLNLISEVHAHVLPIEGDSVDHDPLIRQKKLAVLQQHSRMLQKEILHRAEIEKILKHTYQVREELLTLAGHELKNPLTAFNLSTRVIRSALNAGETSDNFDCIKRSAELSDSQVKRMTLLLDKMLRLVEGIVPEDQSKLIPKS